MNATTRTRRIITCACGCGREGPYEAYGWVAACYRRWLDAGRPDTGPPPPRKPDHRPGKAAQAIIIAARRAAYARLRGRGVSRQVAAAEVGVNERTAYRYEAAMREAGRR